ncbi:MAG: YtxH domain-containing protein [Saprospiraceae bacterium]
MSQKSVVTAFLGGAIVGAAIGILLAPESGKNTRKILIKKAKSSKDAMNRLVEEGKQSWFETRGKMTSEAGVAASELDSFVRHILEKGKSWWKRTKSEAEDVADEIADSYEDSIDDGKRIVRQLAREGKAKAGKLATELDI